LQVCGSCGIAALRSGSAAVGPDARPRAVRAAGDRVTAVHPCRTYPGAAVRSASVSVRPLPGEFERCLRLRRTNPQLSAPPAAMGRLGRFDARRPGGLHRIMASCAGCGCALGLPSNRCVMCPITAAPFGCRRIDAPCVRMRPAALFRHRSTAPVHRVLRVCSLVSSRAAGSRKSRKPAVSRSLKRRQALCPRGTTLVDARARPLAPAGASTSRMRRCTRPHAPDYGGQP